MGATVFDVPYSYDALGGAIQTIIERWRWSYRYHSDEQWPRCEWWDIGRGNGPRGWVITLRGHDDLTWMALDFPEPQDESNLVTTLQADGVPLKPHEQLLYLGKAPKEEGEPWVPTQAKAYRRWCRIWRFTQDKIETDEVICEWLRKMYKEKCSKDTLSKIRKAGNAHLLDILKFG